jgi:hypothetical protein
MAKSGLGRYGMGLPNASISQTKRVEVYTWTNIKSILYNHIDLQEIYDSGVAILPDVEFVNEINIPIIKVGKLKLEDKGTIVRWVLPNKVQPKTIRTLIDHLEKEFGRMFRYYIQGWEEEGKKYKADINFLAFDDNQKGSFEEDKTNTRKKIKAFDPMFLMKNTQTEENCPDSDHPTSELFDHGCLRTYSVQIQKPDGSTEVVNTSVNIRFSHVKREQRTRLGRNAGDTKLGEYYKKRNHTPSSSHQDYNIISVVRAGREIDAGSFGFIGDVSDQTLRWYSIEILFDPVLDGIMGVDNRKQQAKNIKFVDSDKLKDDDIDQIIKDISICINGNIKTLRGIIKDQTQNKAVISSDGDVVICLPLDMDSENGTDPTGGKKIEDEIKKKALDDLIKWIEKRYPDIQKEEVIRIAKYALSIKDYHIFVTSDLGDVDLYSFSVFGDKVLIEINRKHLFYEKFVSQFDNGGAHENEESLRSIRLLIGSLVNAEIELATTNKDINRHQTKFKTRMAESLDAYIEDLYTN